MTFSSYTDLAKGRLYLFFFFKKATAKSQSYRVSLKLFKAHLEWNLCILIRYGIKVQGIASYM